MAIPYGSGWKITGRLVKRTTLTSKKNATWRGYIFALVEMGKTLEVTVTEEVFMSYAEQDELEAFGGFEHFGQRLQLVASKITKLDPVTGKPVVAAPAAVGAASK